jgi:6-phosphogluconolactonase
MSDPTVSRCADADAVADRAAQVVATAIDAARAVRGEAHVALSGGSTIAGVYDRLNALVAEWSDVHLWYGDERVVPLDDEESTHRLATEHLEAPGATWHPVAVDLGLDAAAEAYAAELGDTVLDVALNGMGPDGHTASLFPGSPGLGETARWVVANPVTSPLVHGSTTRLTLTAPAINAARHVRFLIAGADKAAVLAEVLEGPRDPARLPSQLIEPHTGDLAWLLDTAAAARLRGAP